MGRAKARHNDVIQVAFSFDSGIDERVPSAAAPKTPKTRTQRPTTNDQVMPNTPKVRTSRTSRAAANVAQVAPVEAPTQRVKDVAERKPRASARPKPVAPSVVEAVAQPKGKRAAPKASEPVAQPAKAKATAPKAPELVAQPAKAKIAARAKPRQAVHVPTPPVQPTPRKQRRAGQEQPPVSVEPTPVAEANAKASVAKPRTRKAANDVVSTPPVTENVAQPASRGRKQAATEEPRSDGASTTPRAPRKQPRPVEQEPSNEVTFDATNAPSTTPRDMPAGPMFLMSYDDSPKRTVAEKIEAAMVAYQTRFARRPNLVLVNANVASEVEVPDVAIERRSTVPPNNFWAGIQTAPRVVASAE